MTEKNHFRVGWVDLLWLLFLAVLAILSPIRKLDKQLVLIGIGLLQLFESQLVARAPRWGPHLSVLAKILLATLLMQATSSQGAPAIASSYYQIYYLPVITAAIYFGPWVGLAWTTATAGAYLLLLVPALREYQLVPGAAQELGLRILFLPLAGMIVNRFAVENRRQAHRYQNLAETLAETNRRLASAEADARRSERLAALGQLSAGLAHEIRNPLGVIKGSAEMLTRKLDDAAPLARELASNISSEVNRLSALVARFLDFARPSRLELHPQEITALVDRALKAVRDQHADTKVFVQREYGKNLPALMLDEGLCEQVFINLALNAYEALPEGGTLHIKIANATLDGRKGVQIDIKDSGPGIPAELREHIFNPFVTTKNTGAGLGLSIVSKIVDDHRGSIRLTSAPGEGANFRVFLPAEPPPEG